MKKVLSFIKNPKVKMVIILSFLLFIYTTICAISYAQNISSDIANSVFRLHVIANSDSKEDQDLKYIVRDNLLSYMNEICSNCETKQEAIYIVNENKDNALRVEIGEAKGQNWWCVMFPPLCFVDVTSGVVPEESKEIMEENLSEEEFALISDSSNDELQFKFKLIEFFQEHGLLTAKK